jgi:hypothetical protein
VENKKEFSTNNSESGNFSEERKNVREEISDMTEETRNIWAKKNPTMYGRAKTAIEEFIKKRAE